MLKIKIVLAVTTLLLVTIQNPCAGTPPGGNPADITPTHMSRDSDTQGFYFPPPGQGADTQDQRSPQEVGLNPELVNELRGKASRWALWRHGYLVHAEGNFNQNQEVKSLRKTWHALTVGAAIKQGKILSYKQKINQWVDLHDGDNPHRAVDGNIYHDDATWWHVMTQSAGFDYPYSGYPAYKPGQIWTYSDKNPRYLTDALSKAYGKKDHYDNYKDVVKQAYFDAIGMRGWDVTGNHDGARFHFDLEDMGRLGLLVMARGRWNGTEVIPQWFVEELETKQTYGMLANYNGPDDGAIGWDPAVYPECPYGYMTWVNTDQDLYPGADAAWAYGAGAGGTYILWNHRNGIVFAGVGVKTGPASDGIPHIIERNITGPNPFVAKYLGSIGTFAKWAKIEIEMIGRNSQGEGNPNPFDILVDVTFTGPGAQTYVVPGFYDGDGNGGMDGDVWKVRFSADQIGTWTFTSSSSNSRLDGYTGSFDVISPPVSAADFYKWGRLEYVGTPENKIRYLKFRDGPYWLKAGCDDPENFLGSFSNYDTMAKRKAAVDYLAGRRINSLYIMTHNVGGDDRDVWPWLGETPRQAMAHGGRDARFDVAKLAQWRKLFEYMQTRGVVPYLVLEDDSAWKGYDHARYYRELIARFGDLPALLFNFGEEHNENYTLSQGLEFMRELEKIDPYDHPRGIHNVNTPTDQYINAPQVDFTSIQTGAHGKLSGFDKALEHHRATLNWIERCRQLGRRTLVVNFDEGRPEGDRHAWWSAYLAGGVWEAHVFQPYDRPMSAWEPVWTQLGGARTFMESLSFWEMESNDALIKSGTAFCLAKPGEQYALYLPQGGTVKVELQAGVTYDYLWWKATNGKNSSFQDAGACGGGQQTFTAPGNGDWALRIVKKNGSSNPDGYFPPSEAKGGWRKNTNPDFVRSLGIDPAKLEQFGKYNISVRSSSAKSCIVIKNGWVIGEWYGSPEDKAYRQYLSSNGKAYSIILFGMLVDDSKAGRIPVQIDINSKVYDQRWLPEGFPLSDSRRSDITFDHIMKHTSGIIPEANGDIVRANDLDFVHYAVGKDAKYTKSSKLYFDPGTPYANNDWMKTHYSSSGFNHIGLVISNIYEKKASVFLWERLFEPLGFSGVTWHTPYWNASGSGIKWYGSSSPKITPRDYARVAYLLLQKGKWGEKQLVCASWIKRFSSSTDTPNMMSNVDGFFGSQYPADMFRIAGSGLNWAYIIPSMDLIALRTSRAPNSMWDEVRANFLQKLFAAVLQDSPTD